jgi:pyrroloquinoline quinone (PQQ) biosynthesis protein C
MSLASLVLEPRRVYAARTEPATGDVVLTLSDAEVQLDAQGHAAWRAIADALAAGRRCEELPALLSRPAHEVSEALQCLRGVGLLAEPAQDAVSGAEFHARHFAPLLPAWLNKAFSHPFWERMAEGRGSARLYAGWLVELYHYTRNANRHMPLAAAMCRAKPVKTLLARHYEEEWNHYHFFARAAAAMDVALPALRDSEPLPMTREMSDFMRQAARTDVLCYAICSAVLEGTTTDGNAYRPFYDKVQQLYGVPPAAVEPIYEHLALDAKYQHADLFEAICAHEPRLDAQRAARVLDFGHQMVEHIWLWTDEIERWYGDASRPLPRPRFDCTLD